jgi:hypothetical protein
VLVSLKCLNLLGIARSTQVQPESGVQAFADLHRRSSRTAVCGSNDDSYANLDHAL